MAQNIAVQSADDSVSILFPEAVRSSPSGPNEKG